MRRVIRLMTASLAVVAVLGMIQTSFGQIVGYNARGKNSTYNTGTCVFGGPGTASHLGLADFSGCAIPLLPPEGPEFGVPYDVDFNFGGPITATNKHGSLIFSGSDATVTFVDEGDGTVSAIWLAKFTLEEGTGKYKKYKGVPGQPLEVVAINEPFVFGQEVLLYSWRIRGKIDLGKK